MKPFIEVSINRVNFDTPEQAVWYFRNCFDSAYNNHSPSGDEFQYIRAVLKQVFALKSITCNNYGQLKSIELQNGDVLSASGAFKTALQDIQN